jgi:hypothetical protein
MPSFKIPIPLGAGLAIVVLGLLRDVALSANFRTVSRTVGPNLSPPIFSPAFFILFLLLGLGLLFFLILKPGRQLDDLFPFYFRPFC